MYIASGRKAILSKYGIKFGGVVDFLQEACPGNYYYYGVPVRTL